MQGMRSPPRDEHGVPHVFDWLVLHEIEEYAQSTIEDPRPYARIVMSDEAPESKIEPANLRLLRNLEQRNVVALCPINREVFTGGEYRKVMTERANAMIAIGGGKGTYSAGTEMIALGKPVLPLDLQLGSIVQDGEGAVTLYREMVSSPGRFFPNTYQHSRNRLGLLSLDREINDAGTVARAAIEMLDKELSAIAPSDQSMHVKRRVTAVWQATKALPVFASAIRIFEWAKGLLSFT